MSYGGSHEWDVHRPAALEREWQEVAAKPNKGKGKQDNASTTPRENQRKIADKSYGKHSKAANGKWQNAKGQAKQTRLRPKKPKLIEDIGNDDAQAQWRALEPAKISIRIPADLVLADEETLHRLSAEHSTFIASEDRPATGVQSLQFGIWGNGEDAEETRAAINSWIDEASNAKRSSRATKFAKLHSMTPVLRTRAENRWKREVQRQRFRQYPPVHMGFGAIGTFHWPVKDYSPQEILGTHYEALDAIRMDCSCYVVWKNDAFQVMGKNMDRVKAALLRLRQTVFQIAVRQLPLVRMYLLRWQADLRSERVRLEKYEPPRQLNSPMLDETKQHPGPFGSGSRDDRESMSASQTTGSERRTYASIQRTLSKLPYYHGSIRLRLRYGRFLLTQYMLPEGGFYDIDDYERMIQESQFQGLTTDELGDRAMEESALSALQHAEKLLIPLDPTALTLVDVKPVYTAIFNFRDKLGILQLTKTWHEVEESDSKARTFETVSQTWTRFDRETGSKVPLIDISLTDLTTSFGWAITMEAAQAVEEARIPESLVSFALNLKVDAAAASRMAVDKSFVKFPAYVSNVALRSVEQRITYAYGMKDFDYNVELTRFQTTSYPEKTGSIVASTPLQTAESEPRWSVNIHRVEWDTWFAENEQLSTGEKTKWTASSQRWFPQALSCLDDQDEEESFRDLMKTLDELGDVLRSSKMEDLMGGMSIG